MHDSCAAIYVTVVLSAVASSRRSACPNSRILPSQLSVSCEFYEFQVRTSGYCQECLWIYLDVIEKRNFRKILYWL